MLPHKYIRSMLLDSNWDSCIKTKCCSKKCFPNKLFNNTPKHVSGIYNACVYATYLAMIWYRPQAHQSQASRGELSLNKRMKYTNIWASHQFYLWSADVCKQSWACRWRHEIQSAPHGSIFGRNVGIRYVQKHKYTKMQIHTLPAICTMWLLSMSRSSTTRCGPLSWRQVWATCEPNEILACCQSPIQTGQGEKERT